MVIHHIWEQMWCPHPHTVLEQPYLGVALISLHGGQIKGSLNIACSKRYLAGGCVCLVIQPLWLKTSI